ncbi:glycoside hydrolase family 76 protein [Mucilaginibacter sp.]|uniref:glycoside hydrolase family 76 protein n=1 Tax=Mucilaginibacter sp. TaxID=1882438 RepID=UPI003D12079E
MKNILYGWLAVLIVLATSCSKQKVSPQGSGGTTKADTSPIVSAYLTKAVQTYTFSTNNLLTSYNSYRANTTNNANTAYEWYNASQIYADAAMVAAGNASYTTRMNNTYNWLGNLWDKNDVNGGYFAFANLDGSGSSGTKYVDDNSLTGIAYLEAYDVTTGSTQAAYLASAQACANWLIKSGLWDTTFGGGFWWNTDKPNKPTQSNGLALQLFLRLYKITGQAIYHDWAVNINTWLNTKMYSNTNGLYIWQIESSGKVDTQNFTYDNAIMVEADLLYSTIMGDNSYLAKAQALGTAMITTLWNPSHNVFIFNTTDIRVNPCYCGWASQAMIRLYEADKNSSWLTYAKGNIDAINVVLRDANSNGYYQYAGLDGAGRYTNLEGVDQAWMQRVQVLLAKYK